MKSKRKISFLVTIKEFKLLVESGCLNPKIMHAVGRSRSEEGGRMRITFEYESLHKLLNLITSYADQVHYGKKQDLKRLYDKLLHLIKLFNRPGQRTKLI